MSDDDLVERAVVRAIHAKAWAIDLPLRMEECEDLTRVAINAIKAAGYVVVPREPTEKMRIAARNVWKAHEAKRVSITGGGGSLAHPDWEVHYYQAMIDAALEKDKANVG